MRSVLGQLEGVLEFLKSGVLIAGSLECTVPGDDKKLLESILGLFFCLNTITFVHVIEGSGGNS
jgi:hypothetical protein